ncbi:Predicted pyrophosphatase or phosphodiesterase, AlkP superfamily [Maribacter sedimenticola]|uniref:Predicted pyrophosphatase or phosphodiesterase, AlkP superfamily n=1 Tax=Maribacter sedimenticola TaxID=228956 RepID=A0ABY1SMC0_9FLAO|nr:alkaline phosphatase PafA [Maribacter sedimenticola]SNR81415.1 Predicted pyrophosphatase or phosphodiesterase, AlkP superfamily [Maribacter sedimenticola]
MKIRSYFVVAFVLGLFFLSANVVAQNRGKSTTGEDIIRTKPKLVVGIVVDQMRYDYLTRFYDHYGKDGFKRLVEQGFNCKNNHYNYAPTSTGPGHTSVYTGTTPSVHGVIGNNWYDKEIEQDVYCAGDETYSSIGTASNAGKMSPHRMTVTTVTDELRLHNQLRSKTIAIALKDRGAVLPGGHTANAAYWFHGEDEGKWITSSYYMDVLPKWVQDFNASGKAQSYKKAWNTLKDIKEYKESGTDNNAYEGLFNGEKAPTFPHSTTSLLDKDKDFDIIKATPFGNSLTTDFAIEALKQEALGQDDITDFLAVSYSSTDYVGHKYGVNSKEVQDTYLRLDEDLARLFKALDKTVGEGEYTLFLSADHAAIEVPAYLRDQKIPSGYVDNAANSKKLAEFLRYTYGTEDIVKNYSNYQLFLDHKIIKNLDLTLAEVQAEIAQEFLSYDAVDRVYTADQMWNNEYTHGIPYILQNGYNQKRSGDILVVLKPGFISYSETGSTHGSPQIYDTHTPLLFYGKGIKPGATFERTEIPDIAPTISALLGISFPNGTTGKPIIQVLE